MTFAVPGSDDTYHFYKRGYKYISLGDKMIGQSIEVKSSDVRTNTITVKAGWEPIKDMKLTYQLYDPSVVDVLDPQSQPMQLLRVQLLHMAIQSLS